MSGSIRVEGEDLERVDLKTMAGSIDLEGSLAPGARIYSKTYSGDVRLRLPKDTSARFEIESFSGRIETEFVARLGGRIRQHGWSSGGLGRRIDFVVADGDARIGIDSFSGAVRIEESGERDLERRRERRKEREERRRDRAAKRAGKVGAAEKRSKAEFDDSWDPEDD